MMRWVSEPVWKARAGFAWLRAAGTASRGVAKPRAGCASPRSLPPPLSLRLGPRGGFPHRLSGALLALVAVAGALGMARGGGAKALVHRSGEVLRLEAVDAGLLWLEATEKPVGNRQQPDAAASAPRRIVFLPRGSDTPTVVAEDPGIVDFSVRGDVYYVTTPHPLPGPVPHSAASAPPASPSKADGEGERPAGGRLVRLPVHGGTAAVLRSDLHDPRAVLALDGGICWVDIRPKRRFSLPVLPLTRAAALLQVMPTDGGPVRTVAATDADDDGPPPRLIGEQGGFLYWAEYRNLGRPATLLKRVRLPGAAGDAAGVETFASEEGTHGGVLAGGAFYWSGGSREGAPATSFASVNRRTADGRTELLGDWLTSEGELRADGDQVYYCQYGVFALPGDAGAARRLLSLPGSGRLTQISHGDAYAVENEERGGYRIVRQPVR